MSKLAEKVAVITGGGGEIGVAVAKLFAKEGAKILLVDVDEKACKKVVEDIKGDSVSYFIADVTKSDQVQAYVQAAVERYGGIDVFLDNAGIEGVVTPIHEYPEDVFRKVMDVNVVGVFLGLKYVIPVMLGRGGGSIMITSSIMGVKGAPALSGYSTSKHALIGLMRAAASEYGLFNVRVNCINPSGVDSRMMKNLETGFIPIYDMMAGETYTFDEVHEDMLFRIPMRRYATVDDVAKLMLFLAGDDSKFCNGAYYMVDGGQSAC